VTIIAPGAQRAERLPPEVLHAKHRLLPEIGPRGQEALCRATFRLDAGDPAQAIAADLLTRAGLSVAEDGSPLEVPGPSESADPALEEARIALAGALAATERVRTIVGAGARALEWPRALFPELERS